MSIPRRDLLFTSALLMAFLNLFIPASCLPLSAPQAMLMEDKIRLGSTPPSCHNRCNACNPCAAVQVPTLPNRKAGAEPGMGSRASVRPMVYQTSYGQYSNYKPLGWKCRCGDRFYNP